MMVSAVDLRLELYSSNEDVSLAATPATLGELFFACSPRFDALLAQACFLGFKVVAANVNITLPAPSSASLRRNKQFPAAHILDSSLQDRRKSSRDIVGAALQGSSSSTRPSSSSGSTPSENISSYPHVFAGAAFQHPLHTPLPLFQARSLNVFLPCISLTQSAATAAAPADVSEAAAAAPAGAPVEKALPETPILWATTLPSASDMTKKAHETLSFSNPHQEQQQHEEEKSHCAHLRAAALSSHAQMTGSVIPSLLAPFSTSDADACAVSSPMVKWLPSSISPLEHVYNCSSRYMRIQQKQQHLPRSIASATTGQQQQQQQQQCCSFIEQCLCYPIAAVRDADETACPVVLLPPLSATNTAASDNSLVVAHTDCSTVAQNEHVEELFAAGALSRNTNRLKAVGIARGCSLSAPLSCVFGDLLPFAVAAFQASQMELSQVLVVSSMSTSGFRQKKRLQKNNESSGTLRQHEFQLQLQGTSNLDGKQPREPHQLLTLYLAPALPARSCDVLQLRRVTIILKTVSAASTLSTLFPRNLPYYPNNRIDQPSSNYSSNSWSSTSNSGNKNRHSSSGGGRSNRSDCSGSCVEILAVQPTDEATWRFACSSCDCDIISISLKLNAAAAAGGERRCGNSPTSGFSLESATNSTRSGVAAASLLPFSLRRKQVQQAVRRGLFFEVCMSDMLPPPLCDSLCASHDSSSNSSGTSSNSNNNIYFCLLSERLAALQQLLRFVPLKRVLLSSGSTHPSQLLPPAVAAGILLGGCRLRPATTHQGSISGRPAAAAAALASAATALLGRAAARQAAGGACVGGWAGAGGR